MPVSSLQRTALGALARAARLVVLVMAQVRVEKGSRGAKVAADNLSLGSSWNTGRKPKCRAPGLRSYSDRPKISSLSLSGPRGERAHPER